MNHSSDTSFVEDFEESNVEELESDIRGTGFSFLQHCIAGDGEGLAVLFKYGVTETEINERDEHGQTGLSHACEHNYKSVLGVLENVTFMDPNIADVDGNTPLILAAEAGHHDVIKFLLRRFENLDIDYYNNSGYTALMKASLNGRKECIRVILDAERKGGLVRGSTEDGWARYCGYEEEVDSKEYFDGWAKYFGANKENGADTIEYFGDCSSPE